jgi:bifunctional non-homologous end joining protein LigD
VSSFAVLQSALKSGKTRPLVYFVFDLLYLDGQDLRRAALIDRKQALSELLRNAPSGPIQYVDHIEGTAEAFFGECQRLGLEGVVSKRKDRPYREGRSQEWLKSKCVLRDEFVVGGFTEPEGARAGLGSLLVGHFAANGELHYAGRVGTGFEDAMLVDLRRRLGALEVKRSPFAAIARDKVKRGTRWVKPQLVVQVQYAGWSSDGLLWHPVFQGEREDIAAASVVREPVMAVAARPQVSKRSTKSVTAGDSLSREQLAPLSGLQMTHPGRVMYQDPQLSKLDLARYYAAIADWILPHVAGRPLSLVRCPDGQGTEAFYQKRSTAGMPEAIQRVMVDDVEHLVVNDLAGLVSLVQFAVLEIHPW